MSKVSIIVPVYNVERFIERCSRSLFEQSYSNLEYIFINDCSPDKSIDVLNDVIEGYPERKGTIKIVNHDINRGISATRNTGLDNSTGEFVVFVDSDDWLDSHAIELLVKKQSENDADMVSGSRLIHYEDKEELFPEREYKDKVQMTLQMMQHSLDHFVTGRLFRKSLFTDNGLRWNEGYDIAEDRYMMTLLAYHAKVYYTVDSVVYHYERGNVNSVTKTKDGRKIIRNNKQELGNLLFLEQFFGDKEPVYLQECSRCVMEQLEYYKKAAITFFFKDEFYRVVNIIDSRVETELKIIGWKKKGVKGWLLHRFEFGVLVRYINRAIRFIRRQVKAFSHHN